jgi:hypothetical protein
MNINLNPNGLDDIAPDQLRSGAVVTFARL